MNHLPLLLALATIPLAPGLRAADEPTVTESESAVITGSATLGSAPALPPGVTETESGTISAKTIARPLYVGVELISVDTPTRDLFKLPPAGGLLVISVASDSPAAGTLAQGDILLKLDDQLLVTKGQVRALLATKKPGDAAKFTVVRGGVNKVLEVRLAEMPGGVSASTFSAGPLTLRLGSAGDFGNQDELMRKLTERANRMLRKAGGGSGGITLGVPDDDDPVSTTPPDAVIDLAPKSPGGEPSASASHLSVVKTRTVKCPEGTVIITDRDGRRTVVVTDTAGKKLTEGELTEDKRAKLPAWAKDALDRKPPGRS